MTTLNKHLGTSLTSTVDNTKRKELTLPGRASKDFIVTARCRIINVRSKVTITAADLPGDSGGTFTWSTTSRNIHLENTTGPKLVVTAFSIPSTARDSEVVTVTRRALDGSLKTKTVALTVAEVKFSASPKQRYGFDDNDTPVDDGDNHLSVESGEYTFLTVRILGGVDSGDFDFIVASGRVCSVEAPLAATDFDLKITAKKSLKTSSLLSATVRCLSKEIFAKVTVHVYERRVAKVVIAKFSDLTKPSTSLQWTGDDYTLQAAAARPFLRHAVLELRFENFNAANHVTHMPFPDGANDAIIYDFGKTNGGPMMERFRNLLDPYIGYTKVVIVKNIEFCFHLNLYAQSGDQTITVEGSVLLPGKVRIGRGASGEDCEIVSVTGNVGKLAKKLKSSHSFGAVVLTRVMGIADDYIFIKEKGARQDEMKWIVIHEVVHQAFDLRDILDRTNMMHHQNEFLDYRLRYSPRKLARRPGHQNQWDEIKRLRLATDEKVEGTS